MLNSQSPFMKSHSFPTLLLAASLVSLFSSATLPAADSELKVDPQALELLKRMSNTLAAAPAFTYQSKSAVEVPASTGQFLTVFSHADVALKRPNKLSAHLTGDAPHFNFYYDGATVAAFAPGTRVYSASKAPATIDAMLPALQKETGIRFATAPLLFSNPYAVLARGLISGIVVGPATVQGTACTHLAFRSPGVNWEIWLESNARALPRRLAVTFTDRANSPRTLVEFSRWNFRPALRPSDFVLRPPNDAKEIPFAAVMKSAGR